MKALKVAVVIGTRPEAVKMVPVVLALQADHRFAVRLIATGQHRTLLDQVLDHFHLRPDVDLDVMQPDQTLAELAVRALAGLDQALATECPDALLVHGDTSTTLVGALAAFYRQIPVGHVEAGLRTGDLTNPFPEEANRRLVAQLAQAHFAPTAQARANLLKEGVADQRIYVTGNTAIDTLLTIARRRQGAPDRPLVVVECHRRENFGEPLAAVFAGLAEVLSGRPGLRMVISVHPNPNVQAPLAAAFSGLSGVQMIEPPGYPQWISLLESATLLVTDSGGAQEEAPALGVPVVLVRRRTERPEAVAAGTVWRVDPSRDEVRQAVQVLLTDPVRYQQMASAINPYGDGRAAGRVVAGLAHTMGLTDALPAPYTPAAAGSLPQN
ncbi:MAG: non-hydrolyzing UDP-N-acetylglucosamine 2-epimerase [Sulfobacillus sp.]